jgi:ParB-like nuclease domain
MVATRNIQLETWPLTRFIPYARNPRKNDHAVDRMVASIREFGFRVPVLARSSGDVIDGHLRLEAAEKLGIVRRRGGESSAAALGPGREFFRWVARMTVDAFYTSAVGIKDIGYVGNKGMTKYSVPVRSPPWNRGTLWLVLSFRKRIMEAPGVRLLSNRTPGRGTSFL